jgi:hypothetical protein
MSIDKMREDFEKFRDERNATLEREGHKPGSKWHVTNAHYATWQASRESLVIELPAALDAKPYACYEGGWNDMRGESVDAIEAAGLKVKP